LLALLLQALSGLLVGMSRDRLLVRRVRGMMTVFIVGLVVSGLTAIPLVTE
jgi:hypothetical protein